MHVATVNLRVKDDKRSEALSAIDGFIRRMHAWAITAGKQIFFLLIRLKRDLFQRTYPIAVVKQAILA